MCKVKEEDDDTENKWPFVDVKRSTEDVCDGLKRLGGTASLEQLTKYLTPDEVDVLSALEMAGDRARVDYDNETKKWSLPQ